MSAYRTLAAREMAQDGAHDLGHLDRVWANAQAIAAEEGGDLEVLAAAAYLHDLVNLPKDHPARASAARLSAEAAGRLLAGQLRAERAPDFVARVCEAIATHSFSGGGTPETLEARILQDADRLEALGAIGLMRWAMVSGALGRPLWDPEDPFAERRPADDRAWALDHFAVKLLRLPATMQTATGRKMAERRADFLRAFLDQLRSEL